MAVAIGQITIMDILDGSHYEDQYAANTSETAAPTSGWSSNIPIPQAGYYVWKRSRIAYADGTFGLWGTAIRITGSQGPVGGQGPTGPQGPAGDPGEAARVLTLSASATVIRVSTRGQVLSGDIHLTAFRENIPSSVAVVWTVPSGVTLQAIAEQPDARNLLVGTVVSDDTEVTASATHEGTTYTARLSISKVYEASDPPRYLGM
ncbi:MAG: hypothetical protein CVV52_18995, partial [Spirochaetae bacterium HGW-Spirochaetae-8]